VDEASPRLLEARSQHEARRGIREPEPFAVCKDREEFRQLAILGQKITLHRRNVDDKKGRLSALRIPGDDPQRGLEVREVRTGSALELSRCRGSGIDVGVRKRNYTVPAEQSVANGTKEIRPLQDLFYTTWFRSELRERLWGNNLHLRSRAALVEGADLVG